MKHVKLIRNQKRHNVYSRKNAKRKHLIQIGAISACVMYIFVTMSTIIMDTANVRHVMAAYVDSVDEDFSSILLDPNTPVERLEEDVIDIQPITETFVDEAKEPVLNLEVPDPTHESEVVAKTVAAENPVEEAIPVNYPGEPIPDETGFQYYPALDLSEELQRYTWEIAQEYDVRYTLLLAIMYRESRYQPNATHWNSNGTMDSGLMQINDSCRSFLKGYGMTDLMDPYTNIEAGTILLRYYLDECDNNERMALMSYQYGLTGAKRKYQQGITTSKALDLLYNIENCIITTGDCNL